MQKVLFAQCPAKDVHLIMRHAKAFFGRLKTEMYHGRKWSGITPEKFMQQVDTYIRWYNERRIKLSPGAVSPQNVPPTMRAGMIKQSREIVRIPRTVKHRGVDNGFLSLVKRRLLEKCCVRHNRNGEKNGDANQAEKGVSAVTEG